MFCHKVLFLATWFAVFGSAQGLSSTLVEMRALLEALSDVLEFRGSVYDTYAPILGRASAAYDAFDTTVEETIPESRAKNVRQRLQRLISESRFFVAESAAPGFEQGALDTDRYIKANLAEWRYTVNYMTDRLEESFCDIASTTPQRNHHMKVSSTTKAGTEFRDIDWTPTMVVIPAGSYVAGSSKEEHDLWGVDENRRAFELPKRHVTIHRPFAASRTEVTVAQWEAFMDSTCYETRDGARWQDRELDFDFVFNDTLSWRHPGFPQDREGPVVAITRYDAQAYATWLSRMTGAVYRLPTENEWEWAARGGADTTFFWGNDLRPEGDKYANTYDNTSEAINPFPWPSSGLKDDFPFTAPVASFKPNGFGLYDVTANAREYVADDWMPYLAGSRNDESIHNGPAPFPTVRGGAWNYNAKNLRLNYRSAYLSSEVATNMFGIRLVREL